MDKFSPQHLAKHHRRQFFRSLEAKSLRSRNFSTRLADEFSRLCGSPIFLYGNLLVFITWTLANQGLIPGVATFDPYPFGFLTLVVSLEAIVLSIFVLISQNRSAQTATLREELHLQINQIAEREITKILEVVDRIQKKLDIRIDDPELTLMLQDIDSTTLEHSISNQLERADQLVDAKKVMKQLPILNAFSPAHLDRAFSGMNHNLHQISPELKKKKSQE